jgi:UDP-N-acetylmuramoyl-L-alanyl-D-glutamate--2,6-diaminopimelate ligase
MMIEPFNTVKKSLIDIERFLGETFDASMSLDKNVEISGISSNSKEVKPGDIFIALSGENSQGGSFIDSALERGARAVVLDARGMQYKKDVPQNVPLLILENPRSFSGALASWFYGNPSEKLFLAGVTGTNGKTTTTQLLHQIWEHAEKPGGLIGTIGISIGDEKISTSHTTPESDELQRILAVMAERHIENVAMEVSSHALSAKRVSGTRFKVAAFTNLTQDHLDFHGNMENYYQAKKLFFEPILSESALVNIDSLWGSRLFNEVSLPVETVSLRNKKAHWYFEKITPLPGGYELSLRGQGGILLEGSCRLMGEYNLENLILAIAIATKSGMDPLEIERTLPFLKSAPGRLERIELGQPFDVVVDYAHTPDAVERVLLTLKSLAKNRLIAVLGCGGDRDKSKRPMMGSALVDISDVAILTSDNPRSESPEEIIDEMIKGIQLKEGSQKLIDRQEAIRHAIQIAREGDIVAILGKGHEIGQEIAGVVTPFDDRIVAREEILRVL